MFVQVLILKSVCLVIFKDKIPNTFGTENNIVSVKSSDFEVFEALGIDNVATGHVNETLVKNSWFLFFILLFSLSFVIATLRFLMSEFL